jgi:hypothetical protein
MPSFYRINVSRNGTFYFRADNEFINEAQVLEVVADFKARFPESEGFKVQLIRWECVGRYLDVA